MALTLLAACAVEPAADDAVGSQSDELLPRQWIETTTVELGNGTPADIYYPAIAPGWRSYLRDAFPVVVHLQGGSVRGEFYEDYARELSRHGFVVVVPDHRRVLGPPGTPPSPLTDVQLIEHAVAAAEALDGDEGSALHGVVDTESVALTGHSFGGVVGFFALQGVCAPPFCTPPTTIPEIDAAAFFGTHMVQGGVVPPLATGEVPIALLSGTADERALPAQIETTYEALGGPRALVSIDGANHYAITDTNAPDGATPETGEQTLTQEHGVRLIARWAAYWLRLQLRQDPFARFWLERFGGSPDGTVSVRLD